MINRSGIVLIKKQPFLDWLVALPDPVGDEMTLAELNEGATIYLVPDWYDDVERDKLVREGSDVMFESELEGWWTYEAATTLTLTVVATGDSPIEALGVGRPLVGGRHLVPNICRDAEASRAEFGRLLHVRRVVPKHSSPRRRYCP